MSPSSSPLRRFTTRKSARSLSASKSGSRTYVLPIAKRTRTSSLAIPRRPCVACGLRPPISAGVSWSSSSVFASTRRCRLRLLPTRLVLSTLFGKTCSLHVLQAAYLWSRGAMWAKTSWSTLVSGLPRGRFIPCRVFAWRVLPSASILICAIVSPQSLIACR